MKLSNSALGQTTVGQMVNLLSNDVNRCNNDSTTDFLCRFDLSVLFNHYLWCGPLQLVIVTVLLYQRIGPSSLVVGLLSSVSPHTLSFFQGVVLLVMAQQWFTMFNQMRARADQHPRMF